MTLWPGFLYPECQAIERSFLITVAQHQQIAAGRGRPARMTMPKVTGYDGQRRYILSLFDRKMYNEADSDCWRRACRHDHGFGVGSLRHRRSNCRQGRATYRQIQGACSVE